MHTLSLANRAMSISPIIIAALIAIGVALSLCFVA